MTNCKLRVKLYTPSGNPATGLTYTTTGLFVASIGTNEAVTTVYTGTNIEGIAVIGTYAEPTAGKCRFQEIDPVYHAGLYEIQLASARCANNPFIHVTVDSSSGLEQGDIVFSTSSMATAAEIDAQLSSTHGAGRWAAQGSGEIAWQYIVTDCVTHLPVDGVWVNVSTDIAGANIIAQGVTNSLGQVVFWLDAGTYYLWSYRCGYCFPLPDTEIVTGG